MHHWTRRLFALAAPLLLTGCLWGPGKFASDLTLRKDGSFILDYRGEMVLQLPPDEEQASRGSACARRRDVDRTARRAEKSIRTLPEQVSDSLHRTPRSRSRRRDYEAITKGREEAQGIRGDGQDVRPSRTRRRIEPGVRRQADQICRLAVGYVSRQRRVRRRLSFRGPRHAGLPLSGAARQQSDHSVHRAEAPRGRLSPGNGSRIHRRFRADERRDGRRRRHGQGRPVSRAPGPLHRHHRRRGPDQQQRGRRRAASARPGGALGRQCRLDQGARRPSSVCSKPAPLVERAVAHCRPRCHGPVDQSGGTPCAE